MADSTDRHSQKHAAILDGATEVFRTEGFEAASMDRIADVAGVSKRTVYNHFGSKDALFQAVVEQLLGKLAALKSIEWNPEATVETQLRAFASVKALILDDPKWLSLIKVVLGVAITQPEAAERMAAKVKGTDAQLVTWLQAADEAGALHVPDAETAAQLFWAMVSGAVFWPRLFDSSITRADLARAIDEIVETFLCRYRG